MSQPTIAFYMPSLAGGGAERSMLRLMNGLAERGYAIELVVNHARGPYRAELTSNIRVTELTRASKWSACATVFWHLRDEPLGWRLRAVGRRKPILKLQFLKSLADYMRSTSASVMICAMYEANMLAICARACSGASIRLVVSARNDLTRTVAERRSSGDHKHWDDLPGLIAKLYPRADHIVTVSDGVARDLASATGIAAERIHTIYNPVVSQALVADASELPAHPWFHDDGPPVVLAAGRLEPQKDFATLLAAFADLPSDRTERLIILGEGWQRTELQDQADRLGIAERIDLVGWTARPGVFMAQAALFVLSSRYEGLPGVLIEALAHGCPVVATDCPSGPREILCDGRYGALVPVGDSPAMAQAMADTLACPPDRTRQAERGRFFSVTTAVDRYEALIQAR